MKWQRFLLISLCFSVIISLLHCKKVAGEINIGYLEFSSNLPLFVALEKGFFKEEGLVVNPIKLGSTNEAMNALIVGSLDGTVGNGLSTLFAIWQNSPDHFKLYLPCVETLDHFVAHLLVKKDSPINTIEDLKGKKVGTYEGSSQLMYLKLFFQNFLDPDKDISIVQVGTQMQVGALDAGQIDALFTLEPYASVALAKGIAQDLIINPRVKYILNPFPAGANTFSTKFIDNNPGLVKKMYNAFAKASDFILSNEDEAKELLVKYTPLDEETALYSNVYEWLQIEASSQYGPAIQSLADMMFEFGILKQKVNTEKMLLEENAVR